MKKNYKNAVVMLVFFMVIILLLYRSGVGNYFTLSGLRARSAELKVLVEGHYLGAVLIYILCYSLIIASTLPVVAPLTILGGYLFGTIPGGIFAILSATIGSTLSFLFVRYVISHLIKLRYGSRLVKFNEQMHTYGYSYLLTLQLLTIIPFFVINTLAGLADVPLLTFIWTTAVGSTPLLLIYAYAGRQLGELESVKDILKPHMIAILMILALIALIPMVIKRFRKQDEHLA